MTLIPLGRFGRPHGVRGGLRLWPFNPSSELLHAGRTIRVGASPQATRAYEVEALREDAKGIVVQLRGVEDRAAAEALVNQQWFEPREAFPPLDEGEIYFVDLIGLRVEAEDGAPIGEVVDVLDAGGADLLVIQEGAHQHLVPNVPAFVLKIDVAERRVIIRPIEGLLEGR
ncbi:ribosome maturation factor RimM [Myxococcota bacterium]|nr:ribosome maturation factor RimM [Myxococcota bacterium]MBU1432801.1 ribosome maturation factor RimM [Myxococcota bacterium]MBU1897294.1 ribosome maturation factor RimM [Myxococcota bacterium]